MYNWHFRHIQSSVFTIKSIDDYIQNLIHAAVHCSLMSVLNYVYNINYITDTLDWWYTALAYYNTLIKVECISGIIDTTKSTVSCCNHWCSIYIDDLIITLYTVIV